MYGMYRKKFHECFLLNLEIESQLILIVIIDFPKTSELLGPLIEKIQQILPKNKQKLLPTSSLVFYIVRFNI